MSIPANPFDVVVIGAGPAGMLAAIRSAELGKSTLLIERNRKLGVKVLISGGTRCNVTHQTDARGIVAAFGRQGKFLHSALSQFGPSDIVHLLAAEGVGIKTEPNGKIFPATDRALDVQQALIRRLERSGCQIANQSRVLGLEPAGDGFRILSEGAEYCGRHLIVTTGGQSYPGCGTTGDGYRWLETLGHTIIQPHPALVPLRSNAQWLPALSGIALQDVQVFVVPTALLTADQDPLGRLGVVRKKSLLQRRAPLLFTHLGLSGPAPMDVSKAFATSPDPLSLRCVVDLVPSIDALDLEARIETECQRFGKRQIARIVAQALQDTEVPLRLIETLLELGGVPTAKTAAELSKAERSRLISHLKTLAVPITETLGFNKAEVTTGGVDLAEVNPKTMESRLVPGLFIAGELLDLDGWIGGYNFTAAFATGWVAGQSA